MVLVLFVQYQREKGHDIVKKRYLFIASILAVILMGCRAVEQFSPDQVMENVITSETEETPYYGEMTITMTDVDETFEIYVKEWRKGSMSLEEATTDGDVMVTLKDGKKMTIYDAAENTVFESEFDEPAELNYTSRERVENLLELTEDTHTLKKQGDDTIAGRDAIHLVAEKKPGEKSLFGKQEIWIDKENWLVLKTINHTGDNSSTIEYTTLEMDPDMSDDVFEIEMPDDVTIEKLSEEGSDRMITLEEAKAQMETPFMYFPDDDALILEEITSFETLEEQQNNSVELTYYLDGLPYVELSVMLADDSMDADRLEVDDAISESVSVRGNEASYLDLDGAHMLIWEEEGFQYSLWFINPNITREEIEQLVNKMEEVPTTNGGVEENE